MNVLLIISRMLTRSYVYRVSESVEGALDRNLINATNAGIIKFILYVDVNIKNTISTTQMIQYNICKKKVDRIFFYFIILNYISIYNCNS